MSLKEMARQVAEQGRGNDRHLLHITDRELQSLINAGIITKNPKTGLYEAGLGDIFDAVSDFVSPVTDFIGNVVGQGINFGKRALSNPAVDVALAVAAPEVAPGLFADTALSDAALANAGAAETAAATAGAGQGFDIFGGAIGAGGLTDAGVAAAAPSLGGLIPTEATLAGAGSGLGFDSSLAELGADAGAAQSALGVPGFSNLLDASRLVGLGTSPQISSEGGFGPMNIPGVGLEDAGIKQITGPLPTGGGAGSSIFGSLGEIGDFLKKNANLILPGLSLAGSLASKPKLQGVPDLESLARSTSAGSKAAADAANALIPSVSTGNLPAGAQTEVNNAVNDAIGSIKAKYASLGLAGSTMEAQEIAQAQARGEAMKFDLARQLTQTGLQAAGLSAQENLGAANIYQAIMDAQLQSDQAMSDALARFAAASAVGQGGQR